MIQQFGIGTLRLRGAISEPAPQKCLKTLLKNINVDSFYYRMIQALATLRLLVFSSLPRAKVNGDSRFHRKRVAGSETGTEYPFRRLSLESRRQDMLGAAPFCVSEVLENQEIFIALPNVFEKQIKDRRLGRLDAAVLDGVTRADVAHLKSGLEA